MSKHRDPRTGLPCDCPKGGMHEDAPYSYGFQGEEPGVSVRFLFCRKCNMIHFVEIKEEDTTPPPPMTMDDDNELLDGLPHA